MSNEALLADLVTAIERLNTAGDSWTWPGIAQVAIRRWESFDRRHPKAKVVTDNDRIRDLVKGLQAHFEPDVPYTHPTDWRALAEELARVLRTHGG
jgi:hypothetical protein